MGRTHTPRTASRGLLLAALAALLLAVTASAAAAAGRGSTAEIEVASADCVTVRVSSSMSISNVVLRFADGGTQRFEDLPESNTGLFAGAGEAAGGTVTTVWVKSGSNLSGDGPGYGERFGLSCAPEGPEEPEDPKQPEDPEDPEDLDDPDDPQGPDDGDDPADVPPPPRDINDPVDELPSEETHSGDDFDDEVLNAVDELEPNDQDPQVLGVQESNDVVAADVATSELPSAGAGTWITLLVALLSLALGGTLLRRTPGAAA